MPPCCTRWCRQILVLGIWFLVITSSTTMTYAQDRNIEAVRIDGAPTLDGTLDEPFWHQAKPSSGFIQQRPNEGRQVTEHTEVRVVYNDKTLYFGVYAYDSQPEQIIATQMRRDGSLADDDYFQIIIDTYLDRQNGIMFATNPDGARWDAQVRNEGRAEGRINTNKLTEWDGVWDVITTKTEEGWFAEVAIPWRTLRYEAGAEMTFGINFERQIRRRNEQAFWAPVVKPYSIMQVSVAGTMTGLDLAERVERNFQVKPYLLGGAQWSYSTLNTIRNDELDTGVDVKFGVTPNLSMDLTYNTDFSQVEVDDAQVNLTQFDLFFPEKREFFLENAGLFRFGIARDTELFYSRKVGLARDSTGTLREIPILGGGRLTGKAGRTNIGLLAMRTRGKTFGGQVINDNNFLVGRISQDVGGKSNVGFIFTNRQAAGGDYSRAFGGDFNLALGPKLVVSGFMAGTTSDGSNDTGYAGRLWSRWQGPLWQFEGFYKNASEHFNPEMGFFSKRRLAATYGGFHEVSGRAFFTPEPEGSIVRRYIPHIVLVATLGDDGTQLTRQEHYHYEMILRGGEIAGITLDRSFQRTSGTRILGVPLPDGAYTFASSRMHFSSNQSKSIFGGSEFTIGQFFNGKKKTLKLNGGIRAGSKFTLGQRYELNDVDLTDNAGLRQGVTAHIVGTQTTYSFSPNISLRGLIQWNSLGNEFSSNLRFNYIIRPGSDLFIVYNESRDSQASGFLGDPVGRTLVVKLAYLFNL